MELETLRVHNERLLAEVTDKQELARQVHSLSAHQLAASPRSHHMCTYSQSPSVRRVYTIVQAVVW